MYIQAVIIDAQTFDPTTFRKEEIQEGVIAVYATRYDRAHEELQSILFNPELFEQATVEKWMIDNQYEFIEIRTVDESGERESQKKKELVSQT
jgi:hypothetical protein